MMDFVRKHWADLTVAGLIVITMAWLHFNPVTEGEYNAEFEAYAAAQCPQVKRGDPNPSDADRECVGKALIQFVTNKTRQLKGE